MFDELARNNRIEFLAQLKRFSALDVNVSVAMPPQKVDILGRNVNSSNGREHLPQPPVKPDGRVNLHNVARTPYVQHFGPPNPLKCCICPRRKHFQPPLLPRNLKVQTITIERGASGGCERWIVRAFIQHLKLNVAWK